MVEEGQKGEEGGTEFFIDLLKQGSVLYLHFISRSLEEKKRGWYQQGREKWKESERVKEYTPCHPAVDTGSVSPPPRSLAPHPSTLIQHQQLPSAEVGPVERQAW